MSRAWLVSLILAGLSTMSFLDRQVLALLVPDLKRELQITDVQFGLLTGPAFILVYNVILVLAAIVVDRWNRKWMITIGAIVWTSMTICSSLSSNFQELLLFRSGLAFGEALLGPAAISLIGDLFERLDRPLPTAAYITGSVIGSTGSAIMSAGALQLATRLSQGAAFATSPWRLTLILVGAPGLLLALAMMVAAREPPRGGRSVGARDEDGASLWRHMRANGLIYAGVFVGYGLLAMIPSALVIWGPAFLMRSFRVAQVPAGYELGTVSLLGGLCGTAVLPALFRMRFREGQVGHVVGLAVASTAAAAALASIGALTPGLWPALLAFGGVMFLVMGVGTLPTLVIQLYAPAYLRGRISAMLFFLLYLLSSGLAPLLVPLVAHDLFRGDGSLGPSIAALSLIAAPAAAALFWLALPTLKRAEADIRARPSSTA